jgi:DNA-binding IclR family transcriptional regulator
MLDYATVVHESALFTTTMAVPVLVDDILVGVIATLAFQTTLQEPDRRPIRRALHRAAAELSERRADTTVRDTAVRGGQTT